MSLCATCGRPRNETAPFCAGCGTRFADAADAAEPAGAGVTRWDTRVEIPGGLAQSASPPAGPPTVVPPVPAPPTVVPPAPVPPTVVPPVPAPPNPWSRPGPVPPGPAAFGPPPPSPRRGRAGLGVALVIVAVLAVGGGAFALVSALTAHKNGTQAGDQSTNTAPAQPAASGASATSAASSTAAASAGSAGGTVAVAPAAAGDPAAPQVRALLKRYFTAINDHDYAAYSALLDARMRQQNPQSDFATGYATTHDSAETLTSISDAGGGELAATVSFTSHQSPADSIDNSPCTAWTITLYLRPQGSGYLIGTPPPGYHPTHQNCP